MCCGSENSPYSYIIEVNGKKQWCHANHLRKYQERVANVVSNSCAVVFDADSDFGEISSVEAICELADKSKVLLPSQRIGAEKLQHLSEDQRLELRQLLDEFASCFSETPGFCSYVEHCIDVNAEFKPKRLREYRMAEVLKPEIQRQIDELLKNGFIRHSTSAMASPIVPVLKGPSGKGGVRLAIDFRYVNSFSPSDAMTLPHICDAIQKVGASNFITVVDAKSGYWQLNVRESDRWLTAFVFEGNLYEWCRMPFGLKSASQTYCRCAQMILNPIRDFSFSYVDDMTVGSAGWMLHLSHVRCLRKFGRVD